jgi:hypothetical protein
MTFLRGQDEILESFEGIHFLIWDPNSREQIPCARARRWQTAQRHMNRRYQNCRSSSMPTAAKSSTQQANAGTEASLTTAVLSALPAISFRRDHQPFHRGNVKPE